MSTIKKLLIANRGEIAARIIRTAKDLGYHTVAVFSDADRNSLYVSLADQAVYIGGSAVQESYLDPQRIIAAAKASEADAIHPGYGFLSENADFATLCVENQLCFIGPSASAIELMGSKRLSKIAMARAGVPTVPGYEGEDQSISTLIQEAKRVGFPLMIKASAGGGGRGMRLVHDEQNLEDELNRASSEAQSAFGSGELILEKAVIAPRHIEIQVFADQQGNCIHLGERDCSVQRRHQKVVEESPSPFINSEQRELMGAAAIAAAKSCNYVGAGTVEFLVDEQGKFYFLEMNTRLQVEHPVTELVTGTDLVAWQLQIAEGAPLPLTQQEVSFNGHAIEVRLYAEDPAQNYMPQTGTVTCWRPAEGESVRIDHNLHDGSVISSHYDSMQAKVICWGQNRDIARRKLIRALEETTLFGVRSNKYFLRNILRNEAFSNGDVTTAFISDKFNDDDSLHATKPDNEFLALATALFLTQSNQHKGFAQWRSSGSAASTLSLSIGGQSYSMHCSFQGKSLVIQNRNKDAICDLLEVSDLRFLNDSYCEFMLDKVLNRARFCFSGKTLDIEFEGQHQTINDCTHLQQGSEHQSVENLLKAPMDGSLVDVLVSEGDTVRAGQTLAVVEAMKMEHQIKAKADGCVTSIKAANGDQVRARQVLIELTLQLTE